MRKGDWIDEALDKHEAHLLRYAVSLIRDLDQARDVVQDTFLRLCRQDPAKVRDHVVPWLFRVCRNRILELQRRDRRMEQLDVTTVDQLDDPAPTVVEEIDRDEKLELVGRAMAGLTPNQQEVMRLKFQAGLSYREISEVTGLTVGNVGFLLHTAIARVRDRLGVSESANRRFRRIK